MSDNDRIGPSTYMTPEEAKAFHSLFVISMGFFVFMACLAHFMVWMWRPWFPGTEPYKQGLAQTSPVVATQPIDKA